MRLAKLKGRLAELGMSQYELAKKIHMSDNTVGKIINGKVDIKKSHIIKLCDALSIPADEIQEYFFS